MYRTVYIHPPGPTLHGRYLHSSRHSVGAEKGRRWNHLVEIFPKTLSGIGTGTLLVVEQSSLENRSRGVRCTLSYIRYKSRVFFGSRKTEPLAALPITPQRQQQSQHCIWSLKITRKGLQPVKPMNYCRFYPVTGEPVINLRQNKLRLSSNLRVDYRQTPDGLSKIIRTVSHRRRLVDAYAYDTYLTVTE